MEQAPTSSSIYRRALEVTWLAVIFLIPLFFNPQSNNVFILNKTSLLQFLVISMLAFWIADRVLNRGSQPGLKRQDILHSPLQLSILVFGLVAVLATAASIAPAISFWGSYYRKAGLLTLICWILFFLIVGQQIRSREQMFRAIYTLLISSGIVSFLGILEHFFPAAMQNVFQNPYKFGRISSSIGNPLFLSSFLAMVIPFNLALIIRSWGRRKAGNNGKILIGLVILLAFQFWCLWLAQYSITILLYIIAPLVFIIIWGIVKRKKLLLSLGAASLIGLAIIAGLLLVPLLVSSPSVGNVTTGELGSATPSEAVELHTLSDRVQYWQSTVDIFIKSPQVPFSNDKFLVLRKFIGYGPETFTFVFQLLFPDKLKSSYTFSALFVDRPHNDYLYLATTMGLLGLMSYLSILAVFFYLCFRYLRRAKAEIDKLFLIAMVAAMAQYLADIFFNLSTISPELVFWLTLSFVPVIGRLTTTNRTEEIGLTNLAPVDGVRRHRASKTVYYVSACLVGAMIIMGTIISIRPFLADAYLGKGLKLQSHSDGQAVYAFDEATRIEPEEAIYWHSLGVYIYYIARNVTGEPFESKVLSLATFNYNKAVELNPYFASERYFLGDVYTYWAESGATDKWPAALSLYDEASQSFPDNAVILNKWSLALIIKGDFDEAQKKLDLAASVDPEWAETSFLSGLLLTKEGKNDDAALKIIQPITDKPSNLNYFIDLCDILTTYDMVRPLGDCLEIYAQGRPDDWTAHALLGTTSLFSDNLTKGLDEFNTAMMLVPDNNVGDLFGAVLKLTTMSTAFKTELPGVAIEWRNKLAQSPERETLLPALDRLIGISK